MKVVILAGGTGTRLGEYTDNIPKPMVSIGEKPIIWHIMKHYGKYSHKDFILALGYKSEVIKKYFINYQFLNSDFSINLKNQKITTYDEDTVDWNVSLINTGNKSMTGGRLKRLKKYIGNETFLLTYGDGLSNVNINDLISFHKKHRKMITVTAVRPTARFGELKIQDEKVFNFSEKPQIKDGWINGGYFVIEPKFLDLISDDYTVLEKDPMEQAVKMEELVAFKHEGFWQCMDTKRDKELLENLFINNPEWLH